MVRLLAAILACTLAPSLAAAAPTAAPAPPATPAVAKPAAKPAPPLDWRSRLAVAVRELQKTDPALLARLENLQPVRAVDGELSFAAEALHDRRAATVLLRRLLAGKDPAEVRGAIVDALPQTGGDWQEGAAALVGLDASPRVRKKLIEVMRYADPPHSIHGLRLGFKDEDPDVNVAAARAAGFHKHGAELFDELYSATFDTDWDLRAAAVQALGMLKVPRSREILIKALRDEEREVRLQALLALEQLDPDGLLELPELDRLAKDRKSHRIARKAQLLLQERRARRRAGGAARVTTAKTAAPAAKATPPAAP
jgi:HEAT repeat protein